jgi:cytidylate kinase
MTVVTVSGQPGTRTRDVGRLAAERLGIDYIDQEILVEAARTLGVPMETVVPFEEERATGLGERLAAMLRRFLEQSAAAGAADPLMGAGGLDIVLGRTYAEAAAQAGLREVSDERYLATLTSIIRDLAAHDNVLIIGRGSQVILKDWPGALHVLLVAPVQQRIQAFAAWQGVARDEATKRVHESTKGRAAFHHTLFKVEVDDPSLYHLTLNTACVSLEGAAQIIAEVAQHFAQRQP